MLSVYWAGVDEAGGRGVDSGVKNANSQADSDSTPLRQQGRTQVSAAYCSAHLPRDRTTDSSRLWKWTEKLGFDGQMNHFTTPISKKCNMKQLL